MSMLSIIVPVYNMEDTLDKCVQSIVSQSFRDWEMILVDDGSTDDSGTMCDEWAKKEPRISVIHKENGGLSDARNAGLDIAKGDYITFVDSDDYLNAGTYEKMIQSLCEHSDIGIMEYSIKSIGYERLDLEYKDRIYLDADSYWTETKAWNHAYMWNKIFRRDMFDGIRFKQGRKFEDLILLPQMLRKKHPRVATSSFVGYNYVYREGSINAIPSPSNIFQCLLAEIYAAWTMRTFPWSKNGKNLYYYMCCRVYDVVRFSLASLRRALQTPQRPSCSRDVS